MLIFSSAVKLYLLRFSKYQFVTDNDSASAFNKIPTSRRSESVSLNSVERAENEGVIG